jgi:DNA polymerase I-like protein with 3'-5' exonuclease and polymerase domains
LALLAPRRLAYLEKSHAVFSPTLEKLTDRLNAPVQGTAADGLKLALALLWERRSECPEAMPILVCHNEVGVECEAERAADAKAWLEGAMIEGMDTVLNSTSLNYS